MRHIAFLDSNCGIRVTILDNLLTLPLMMGLGREGTPMIPTIPVATTTPVAGRLLQTGIQGGGRRLIEGGEGVGGSGHNDRPGLLVF